MEIKLDSATSRCGDLTKMKQLSRSIFLLPLSLTQISAAYNLTSNRNFCVSIFHIYFDSKETLQAF